MIFVCEQCGLICRDSEANVIQGPLPQRRACVRACVLSPVQKARGVVACLGVGVWRASVTRWRTAREIMRVEAANQELREYADAVQRAYVVGEAA